MHVHAGASRNQDAVLDEWMEGWTHRLMSKPVMCLNCGTWQPILKSGVYARTSRAATRTVHLQVDSGPDRSRYQILRVISCLLRPRTL
eukprot:6484033-Amphidinium_carterae.1